MNTKEKNIIPFVIKDITNVSQCLAQVNAQNTFNDQIVLTEKTLKELYLKSEYKLGALCCQSLLEEFVKPDEFRALCLYYYTIFNNFLSDIATALIAINEAISIYKKKGNDTRLSMCYNVIGNIHLITENYDEALDYFIDCLKIAKKRKDIALIFKVTTNISLIYQYTHQPLIGVAYLEKAEALIGAIEEEYLKIALYAHFGCYLLDIGDYQEADEKFKKALSFNVIEQYPNIYSQVLSGLAVSYYERRTTENDHLIKAAEYGEKSHQLLRLVGGLSNAKISSIDIYLKILNKQSNHKEAIKVFEEIEPILDYTIQLDFSVMIYEASVAYEKLGNNDKALQWYKKLAKIYKHKEQVNINNSIVDRKMKRIKDSSDYTNKLEDEIEKRKIVEQKLLESNKELSSFATIASHDMREPLRMVSSYSQLLQRRVKNDNDLSEFTDYIVDASIRMQHILSDLIEFVRIKTEVAKIEVVNLDNILELQILNFRKEIAQKHIKIEQLNKLPIINGVANYFNILFKNLISNAIKYHTSTPTYYKL